MITAESFSQHIMSSSKGRITAEYIKQLSSKLKPDWESILHPRLFKTLNTYAQLICVEIDLVILPIMSLTAALMGNSSIKVDDLGFVEPAILRTIAVQEKGKGLFQIHLHLDQC